MLNTTRQPYSVKVYNSSKHTKNIHTYSVNAMWFYMCVRVCVYMCIYIYIYMYIYICMCVYIYIYIHTYIYMCIYIYIPSQTRLNCICIRLSGRCVIVIMPPSGFCSNCQSIQTTYRSHAMQFYVWFLFHLLLASFNPHAAHK